MAKGRDLSDFETDYEAYFDRAFNNLIKGAVEALATRENSPVYTGLFASSWKADTRQIQKDSSNKAIPSNERRRNQEPWRSVYKSRGEKPGVIQPRYSTKDYNFKMLKGNDPKVFIGNTTDYRNWALGDSKNLSDPGKTLRFILSFRERIDAVFQEKPRLAGIAVGVKPFDDIRGRRATGYERIL